MAGKCGMTHRCGCGPAGAGEAPWGFFDHGKPMYRFWVVVDPGPVSTLGDIAWETTPGDFGRWWRGGPNVDPAREAADRRMRVYTNEAAAHRDAEERLKARKVYDAACTRAAGLD